MYGNSLRNRPITQEVRVVRDVLVFTPVKRLEAATVAALTGLVWPGALTL